MTCIALLVLMQGCGTGDDAQSAGSEETQFEGKVDERFVGVWKSKVGQSEYELKKDGTYHLESTVNTPGGKLDTKSDGKWLVSGDMLLFQDPQGSTSKYKFELKEGTLTLLLNGKSNHKTELVRS